eukprot:COSAG02_NODE_5663_length_4144_cov_59.133251_1_plen_418_part_10
MARWLSLLPPLLLLSNLCVDTPLAAAADSVGDMAVGGEAPTKSEWVWARERQSCEEACKEYNNHTECRDGTQIDQQTWDYARWSPEAERKPFVAVSAGYGKGLRFDYDLKAGKGGALYECWLTVPGDDEPSGNEPNTYPSKAVDGHDIQVCYLLRGGAKAKCDVSPQQYRTRRICSCLPIVQGGQYDPSLLLVCMIWSFGSVAMVIPMVRRPTPRSNTEWTTPIVRYYGLKYDCPELTTPLNHAEDQHVLGWIGLGQFVLGLVDLASSAWLIYKLWNFDDEPWLWRCAAVTFAVTTLATALVCQDAIQVLKDPMTQPPRNGGMEPRSLDSMTASVRSHQVSRRAELQQDQVSVLMEKAWAVGIDRDTLFGILDCVGQDGDSMSKTQLQESIVHLIMEEASPRANPEATDRWVKAHGLL